MSQADQLLELSNTLNQEETLEALEETAQNLLTPTADDEADVRIYLERILKSLSTRKFEAFVAQMQKLDGFIRNFKHESFESDFLDLALDQNLWNWIYALDLKKIDTQDLFLMTIIKDEVSSLLSKEQLFV